MKILRFFSTATFGLWARQCWLMVSKGFAFWFGFLVAIAIGFLVYAAGSWDTNMTTVTDGQLLTATGWNAIVNNVNYLSGQIAGTSGGKQKIQLFTSNGTFTVPSWVTSAKVTVQWAGAGGSANGGVGSNGGVSSFGSYASANGGNGNGGGGAGGCGTVGDLLLCGSAGNSAGSPAGSPSWYLLSTGSWSAGFGGGFYGAGGTGGWSSGMGAGGAGGLAIKTVTGLTPGASIPVTVWVHGCYYNASYCGVSGSSSNGGDGYVIVEWIQ